MHSFAIRVRAEKQKQKQKEGIKPSPAAIAAAKKKLLHQQGSKKPKANGVKKPGSNKPANPSNKQGKNKKKTALPEITYHVATTRPAWADEPGERYGAYHRFLQEQKQKAIKEKENPQPKKPMKNSHSKALSAHRRWLKKNNKVQDVSKEEEETKSTDAKEKEPPKEPKENSGAAIVLYVGVGLIVIGLIMTFVGMGEDGFRTIELQLVGPSLLGMGIFFCLLRILSCAFAEFFARKCPCCCKMPKGQDTTTTPPAENSSKPETAVNTPRTEQTDPVTESLETPPLPDTHVPTSSSKPPPTPGQPSSDVITFVNEATTRASFGRVTTGVGNVESTANQMTGSELEEWYSEFEEVKLNPPRTSNRNNELILNPNKLLR